MVNFNGAKKDRQTRVLVMGVEPFLQLACTPRSSGGRIQYKWYNFLTRFEPPHNSGTICIVLRTSLGFFLLRNPLVQNAFQLALSVQFPTLPFRIYYCSRLFDYEPNSKHVHHSMSSLETKATIVHISCTSEDTSFFSGGRSV